MAGLLLTATVPVFLGILGAGTLGHRFGKAALWAGLLASVALAALWWGTSAGWETHTPIAQRFLAPLSVYVPPLIVGGGVLVGVGRQRWRIHVVLSVAAALALANIFLAPFFFVLGCGAQLWVCP